LALKNLLVDASPASRERMLKFFKNRGKIRLLVLGGIFAGDFSGDRLMDAERLDLLVVGETKRTATEKFIKKIEAEVGKELNWTLMSTPEFERRLAMHDKLLRDLLDFPHEFLINKLGVE
jgi:putative NADH-flavin reductase